MAHPENTGKEKRAAAYPLRFRSRAEKAKIEKAAKAVRQSLRDFILEVASERADQIIRAGINLGQTVSRSLEKAS